MSTFYHIKEANNYPDDYPATTTTPATTIDNRPYQLILHIFSFLQTLHTSTTSLISKKWYPLWSINSSLDFFPQFPPYKSPSTTSNSSSKIGSVCISILGFVMPSRITRKRSISTSASLLMNLVYVILMIFHFCFKEREVVPFCWKFTKKKRQSLFYYVAKLRRVENCDPFITDNGNYICGLVF